MVERVTGGKALPAEVLEQILARTDGVPLFVEELTKAVLESGLLADEGDRYELAGPLPPLAIPATLQDSLMARLDRLAPVKEVAQVAACIGREFAHDLLAAVAGAAGRPSCERALDAAGRGGAGLPRAARRPTRPTLQARAGAGRRLPEPAQEPAAGAARAGSRRPWRSSFPTAPRADQEVLAPRTTTSEAGLLDKASRASGHAAGKRALGGGAGQREQQAAHSSGAPWQRPRGAGRGGRRSAPGSSISGSSSIWPCTRPASSTRRERTWPTRSGWRKRWAIPSGCASSCHVRPTSWRRWGTSP